MLLSNSSVVSKLFYILKYNSIVEPSEIERVSHVIKKNIIIFSVMAKIYILSHFKLSVMVPYYLIR